jgi:hypothetical protein
MLKIFLKSWVRNRAIFWSLLRRRTLAKSIEKTFPTVCQVFENLRLGSINFPNISTSVRCSKFMIPKRRFWKAEQIRLWSIKVYAHQAKIFGRRNKRSSVTFRCIFNKSSPRWVLTPFKSTSRRYACSFVPSSKIFVWGA